MIDIIKIGLLYDFYESLLTRRQRTVLDMYLNDNLSLAEISAEIDITRQGVHDIITRTAARLMEYEEKLKLSERTLNNRRIAKEAMEEIINGNTDAAIGYLRKITEG
ncbi:MAG TPA: sigma factor-like helix-turn-helix DNA-binding protein [Clostridia bacterium]|nr:sigma factor-like helix-turn-helix DNA-binding protein [Clostridia bacterium]HPQ46028.1 sigma factor-like helix-turn-helix DNA-binding protein [Clostridia bacterium]HRX41973.1 sigma factor-like helix-turn-helix DNA-binding protein [Clostridia bacterium]